jgi:hypothetical protein
VHRGGVIVALLVGYVLEEEVRWSKAEDCFAEFHH